MAASSCAWTALVGIAADLRLEVVIIAFDPPLELRRFDESFERDVN